MFCTDFTLIGPLKNEQEVWLNSEYYQQVYNVLKADTYAAVVFSKDHFNPMITNYKATETEFIHPFLQFNYSTELQEASYWLSSIKKDQVALV